MNHTHNNYAKAASTPREAIKYKRYKSFRIE